MTLCKESGCNEKATTIVEIERELSTGYTIRMTTEFCRKCFVNIAKNNTWNVVMHTPLEES